MAQEPVFYFNGQFVPASQAKVSVMDRGFRWGDAVYETLRTFQGKIFKAKQHLERLRGSLLYSRINLGMTMEELEGVMHKVVEKNAPSWKPNEDYEVQVVVSRGLADPTRRLLGSSATVAVFLESMDFPRFAREYLKGIRMVTPATRRTPPQCVSPKAKIANKMNHFVAQLEAQLADPEAEALMLDVDGNITEATGANFLFLAGGRLRVPNRRQVLGGISMETVLELADRLDIPWEEGSYSPHDLYTADEAFLTTTPFCLAPVVAVNAIPIGKGVPGPMANRLLHAWSEMVGMDFVDQSLSFLTPEERRALEQESKAPA